MSARMACASAPAAPARSASRSSRHCSWCLHSHGTSVASPRCDPPIRLEQQRRRRRLQRAGQRMRGQWRADVFKIQDEVATEVVRALEVSLPANDQERLTQKRTESVEAYQEYLKGIALMPGRKVAEMRTAAQHFERAIVLDSNYARAYV